MLTVSRTAFDVLALILASALCLHPAVVTAQGRTQKISKKLVERAEDMVKDVGKTRAQVVKSVGKYNAVFQGSKLKDRQKAYTSLLNEIKKTEEMVKQVRKDADTMQKEADKFFNEWNKGLTKVTDNELRLLGFKNMTEGRERYGKVVESGLKAGSLYGAFVTDLKNQCSYLELDMSDAAMTRLGPNREQTSTRAATLYQSVDELTSATRGYIASMK
jgi:hypothetical protein